MHRPDYCNCEYGLHASLSGVVRGAGGGGRGASPWRHATHERSDLLEIRLVRRPPTTVVSILRFMLLEVPIKIRLLPEAAVAVTTPERPFFIMNVPHMPLEIRRYREGALAVFTAVGLLACMRS